MWKWIKYIPSVDIAILNKPERDSYIWITILLRARRVIIMKI